ncbi:Zinc carboxypeptidase [Parageobacillus caldoxylosilyticus]|uniref:M14 family zinc carboxypeptidase n=1 Tax=Saccharococcus caldoxylosilyticus TaxID=81408 RepID=UPI001C4DEF6B|nr:M14 family zinc carboxypeptidase [Parageobacillus caldoxylosilyticus]QXJ40031.1 Zinc carboxypeptidase [Parageobacillus caldoxylosilyticus]
MKRKKILSGLLAIGVLASAPWSTTLAKSTKWTNVNTFEEQDGSKFNSENYDFVKFSQIGAKLKEIEKQSNRVKLEIRGTSANGYPLYVVTIADPSAQGKFGKFKALRKQMFKNPGKAQDWVTNNEDFKVPIMINGSIHGNEFVGSDAILQLIERFATQNDEVTKKILANTILIFNVVQNPDGRINATRFNGAGIDLNRDFITQSQPETRETVELIKEWNPMVFLDTHGYVKNYAPNKQGLIEPCTPPHNPNYEYDLYNKWAFQQAEAMEKEIMANKDKYKGALYQTMEGTYIPQRDDTAGWDDYPPIFTPMYAMYHGAYGHTLEAPTNDWDGVRWHYDAIMGALKFATEHKQEMMKDQIEIFKRGITFNHSYHPDGFFPKAYILPVDAEDPTVTEKAVRHLLRNDIEVLQASKPFSVDGKTYAKGTYIVKMDQAKAGLANTMLWDGEDITNDTPAMYDISAWSLPELWGFEAVATDSDIEVTATKVHQVNNQGSISGKGPYIILNSSVQAVNLVNTLLQQGVPVKRDSKGNFYTEAAANDIFEAVKESGLHLQTATVPADAVALSNVKIAILKDGGMGKQQSHAGTKLALNRLGFQVTELTPVDVATKGLDGFDVFIYSGTENLISLNLSDANKEFGLQNSEQYNAFKANVTKFVESGGKYIAIGAGASLATKTLGLTDDIINVGGSNSNGIVKVNYKGTEVTAGYGQNDIGFVYRPAWYTGTENDIVEATYLDQPDFFIAGHWRNRDAAQGQAVIVREKNKGVTLIGLEAGFRDHTDYLFRLLSNAIFTN